MAGSRGATVISIASTMERGKRVSALAGGFSAPSPRCKQLLIEPVPARKVEMVADDASPAAVLVGTSTDASRTSYGGETSNGNARPLSQRHS